MKIIQKRRKEKAEVADTTTEQSLQEKITSFYTPEILGTCIDNVYRMWKNYYTKGADTRDYFFTDGFHCNRLRTHISYYRRKCEDLLGDNFLLYPEQYFYCDLPEVPEKYMARDRMMLRKGSNQFYTVCETEREYEVKF